MNIALVVLDTLRKDAFDEHFDWLPGTTYENAWSTSHWTVPAHAGLFTGHYGSEVGTFARNMHLDTDDAVLAELLSDAGYRTRAFSANVSISPPFDFDRGFDTFEKSRKLKLASQYLFDWREFILETRAADRGPSRFVEGVVRCLGSDHKTVPSLKHGLELKLGDLGFDVGPPDDGARAALGLVRDADFGDQEFLFMNLMEAHGPYDPPSEYRTVDDYEMPEKHPLGLDPDGLVDPEPVRQAYDDSVRYLADVYRELFAELTEDFDYVITLSDHGNCFGEHGVYGHTYGLSPELTHVPLSVYDGTDEDATDETVTSILDVHRTVLDLAGVDAPSRGRNLFDGDRSTDLVTEYHGITLREKVESLRRQDIDEETIEGFDQWLSGVVTPDSEYGYETHDGFEVPGEGDADQLRERLTVAVEALDRVDPDDDLDDDDLDDAVLSQLEDLGYA